MGIAGCCFHRATPVSEAPLSSRKEATAAQARARGVVLQWSDMALGASRTLDASRVRRVARSAVSACIGLCCALLCCASAPTLPSYALLPPHR